MAMAIVALAMAVFAVASEASTTPGVGMTPMAPAGIGNPAPDVGGAPFALFLAAVAAFAVVFIARRRRTVPVEPTGAGRDGEVGVGTLSEATDTSALATGGVDEAYIPRWRRPSLAAARLRTDATAAQRAGAIAPRAPSRPPHVFATPVEPPAERLYVRYDGVLLMDRPDEALGRRLAELDAGDEVDVLERDDAWARAMTPLGVAGWLPGMALTATRPAFVEIAPDVPAEEDPDPTPPADEPPLLDTLVQAVVAARRARNEPTKLGDLLDASSKPRGRRRQPQVKAPDRAPAASATPRRSSPRRGPATRGA
jgi:hypothetical protein